jgi:hypothetical protein
MWEIEGVVELLAGSGVNVGDERVVVLVAGSGVNVGDRESSGIGGGEEIERIVELHL